MIVDARAQPPVAPLECDVCVVGAGAAGLTVALELAASGHAIHVFEAGGPSLARASQSMLTGETDGGSYPPLHTVRAAGLGGSTLVWAGWGRPLDPIDFEAREAVPHSGWPFGLDELRPHYRRAHELLRLGPCEYDPDAWETETGTHGLRPAGTDFANVLFRQCQASFGDLHGETLRRSQNVRVWLRAQVLRLNFAQNGLAVTSLEVATPGGSRFSVRPRAVVLAAGGIETPRLMLLSAGGPRGPGNGHDLVGRYFIDHGYDDGALYVPADPLMPLDFYFPASIATYAGRRSARGALAATSATLRREGLMNCAIYFRPAYEEHPAFRDDGVQAALELWDMLRSRAVPERRLGRAARALRSPRALSLAFWRKLRYRARPNGKVRLLTLFECAPHRDNRVALGSARDPFGRPVARLRWRIDESDLASITRTYRLLDAALRSAGLGRVDLDRVLAGGARPLAFGKHHLGTMRMHRDPAHGVVDADARVHGVANLFVAGSSVFTTAGFANPTLTIVALSSRLAAYLDRQLRSAR